MVLFHCGVAWAGGGFVGVDLFFVLSGFLVSNVILAEIDERGSFDLGRFYARRVRRLLPAAVLVILTTAFVQILVASQTQRLSYVADARAALLYVANWQFIGDSRNYFAADIDQSPYLHFWSLSIEEQFYIGLPLLVLALVRFGGRHTERLMLVTVAGVFVASLVSQIWTARSDVDYAYYATHARLYQLAAGVLLALVLRRWSITPRLTSPAALAAPVGVAGILVLGSGLVDVSASTRGILVTVASVLAIAGLYAAPHLSGRVLARALPRYLGQISYGTYLWHWPVILFLEATLDVRPVVLAALAIPVSTGLASLSYVVLETPVRRTRVLDARRWPVVVGGLAVSLVAAFTVVPVLLELDRRPSVAGGAHGGQLDRLSGQAGWLTRPVPTGLDLVAAAADVPRPGEICTPGDLDVCERVSGEGPHVVLVGDSQAQMFLGAFESLARERGFRLSTSVLAACAWQQGLQNERAGPEDQATCRAARETFYGDVLPLLDADLVIVIGLSRTDQPWERLLIAPGGPADETLLQRQLRTAEETTALVRASGAGLVLVKSLLGTRGFGIEGPDPLDCLARAETLGDCAVIPPLGRPALDGFYDVIAATTDGVTTVDLNPVLCPRSPLCEPVIDGTVVWREADHVTGSFL